MPDELRSYRNIIVMVAVFAAILLGARWLGENLPPNVGPTATPVAPRTRTPSVNNVKAETPTEAQKNVAVFYTGNRTSLNARIPPEAAPTFCFKSTERGAILYEHGRVVVPSGQSATVPGAGHNYVISPGDTSKFSFGPGICPE